GRLGLVYAGAEGPGLLDHPPHVRREVAGACVAEGSFDRLAARVVVAHDPPRRVQRRLAVARAESGPHFVARRDRVGGRRLDVLHARPAAALAATIRDHATPVARRARLLDDLGLTGR